MNEAPSATGVLTVIGIGNPYRCDDGVAGAVLARLAERFGAEARVRLIELDGEPSRLMQAWAAADVVWVVDAIRSGRPQGTVTELRLDALADLDDAARRLGGGHLTGLGDAVELARVLDRMPRRLRVLGIEGGSFGHGVGLSPAVVAAVAVAADRIADDLATRLA